ncbi:UPF0146 family protein [Pyrococcus abyssi]|uniref:UPF0146 protein PYRAB01940 n=1 Tax=Pyrococcus abyssi (strain GE5 / Orsay) TaxID=272844 RepID=Y194_PYRAB|nr:UPF0146 family protein [Pyrococcus abyssi]Q9V280.1 RecName: Full=UPF0146 protein PYRAB01940 [Pyrococcus abyssi GE5]CAB49118.1 Hypothetical protein PAB2224 [Pyrococcus abyssi GE5]CCE69570.1 TPA: hypothetical protein PAB2224 [Pyrococcus abyssi GE5]
MIEVAEFIAREVKKGKVIEVGIGFYTRIAKRLKELGFDVLAIDINKDAVVNAKNSGLNAEVDDIFNPNISLYMGAKAIYSIRPTPEMMNYILKISKAVKVPAYIVPLTGDPVPQGMKLITYRGIPIYKWEP